MILKLNIGINNMSQQLVKKGTNGRMINVNPKSWIEAIKDKNTGQTLVEILQGFNMYFLPYNGNTSSTRCLVPTMLRKKGLWITYVKYDGNVYTEWYAADEIDDKSWGDSSNWRIGNNTLVGDITISSNGNWVINGTETEFKAVGENGNTPMLRVVNNRLQVSYNLGENYMDITDNPVYTKFRWLATSGDTQANNVGRIQASVDEGKTWTNMSNDFTNNLHISKYIGVNESLPTSDIAEGTIYAKGPYFEEGDTLNDNPIYRLWVYAWKGNTLAWQDNGEFTSIAAGIVQKTGDSETEVMSQKAVTEELTDLASEVVLLASRVDYGVIAKKHINSALSNDWGNERFVLKNQSVNATDGEIITINNNTSTLLYCSLIFEDDSTTSVKTQANSTIDIYSNNYELSITKITVYFLETDSVEGEVDVLIHNRNSLTEQLSELKRDILGKNYTYTTNAINPSFSAIPTIKKGVKIVIELTEDGNNGSNILYVYGKTYSTDSTSITMAKFSKGSVVGDKIEYIAENDISFIKMTGGEDGNRKSINILYVGAIEGLEDDIQKNKEKINEINSELGNVKDNMSSLLNSYDSTALKVGMYAFTADSGVKPTYGNTAAIHLTFICGNFECKEGWTVKLNTVGGTGTARAYCFTDSERNIISRYEAVADCDVVMTAPKGASYIYVNCLATSSDVFSLKLYSDFGESIEKINKQIEELNQNSLSFPQIHTQPIRRRSKDEPIRVFLFGSSWHMNTWWYLNKLIKEAGINAYIEAWFSDGAYFSQWLSRYRGEAEQSNLRRYVSTNGSNWSVTMTENIGVTDFRDSLQLANWDIIGFQQGAVKGIDWENYQDYWSDIVSMVRSNASNDTVIAYNATWAPPIYSSYLSEQNLKGQEEWMTKANGCFTKFLSLSGIVEVIPQGSMMWAVRSSSDLNDEDDLCKDSLHLKNGLPIYATGANWFESIIQPMFGTSINDISWLPTEETQACPTSTGYFTSINTEQAVLIKKIIRLAASNRWGLPSL